MSNIFIIGYIIIGNILNFGIINCINTSDNNMEQIKKALQGLQRDELVDLHPNYKEPTHVSLPKHL